MRFARLPLLLSAAVVASVGAAAPSAAQDDTRWSPFLGCWDAVSERDAELGIVLCISPTENPFESEWETFFEDGERTVERVAADGRFRPLEEGSCEGESAARFADDGRRIYLEGRFDCESPDRPPTSGMLARVSRDRFIDVRAMQVEGTEVAFVQRYERTSPPEALEGRDPAATVPNYVGAVASAPPSWSTIAEVDRAVASPVTVAWLAEVGIQEPVDGARLVQLADAGVGDDVLDVLVALSNPGRFAFRGDFDDGSRAGLGGNALGTRVSQIDDRFGFGARRFGMWGSPFFFDPFLDPFWGFGFNRFGLNRFGWGGWGGFGGWGWGGGPFFGNVVPITGGIDGGGRAVRGRGYTRGGVIGQPRARSTRGPGVRSGSSGTRTARPRGSVRRGGGGSAVRSGGGRAAVRSGGRASSGRGGYSRGGVRRGGGRF